MPVDDVPVHAKVKVHSDFRYGCHNRKPYAASYYSPDRVYRPNGTFYIVLKENSHAMSRECRYDLSESDPHCADCNTPKDERYLNDLRRLQAEAKA